MLKLGIIGLSEGNGHPYSWSAIINGSYAPEIMAECGYPTIPAYLGANKDTLGIGDTQVTHNMDAKMLKAKYGDRVVFWGGGVDTQITLPFGTPEEVKAEVMQRGQIFEAGGGFVFCSIHNLQANIPIENIVAMFEVLREINRR